MEDIKYCCDTFEWLISDKGKKGLSILPVEIAQKYCFVLQSRSHDIDNILVGNHIVFQQTIHFCPWCGTNLSELIENNKAKIAELSKLNKNIML